MRTKTKIPVLKERVIELLKDAGKTQKQMAADLFISPEQLNRCLTAGMISKPWLIAIADYLNCSPDWLSSKDATPLNAFGYKRGNALANQDEILKSLFVLLGYPENRYGELTEIDIEALKTDIDMLLAYRLQKSRTRI